MKTVAVQLTGPGMGAIAVILLAGEKALEIAGALSRGRVKEPAVGAIVRAGIYDPAAAADGPLDDALVIRISQDRFELHVHGGRAVVQAVLAVLEQSGAEIVSPEDASEWGLLGTKMRGAVALSMQRARTLTAARLLAGQLDSGLTAWCARWRAWLLKTPRESWELWPLHAAAQWLLLRSQALARLLVPPRIALIGPPNAGKSTLANALLGRPVSITSEIAGTTRDWVDATAVFVHGNAQVAVTLVDTAGVRETEDPLEQLSIQRTQQQAAAADLVIFVQDATRPEPTEANDVIFPNRVLQVQNKSDLAGTATVMSGAIAISAKTGAGRDALMRAVLACLEIAEVEESEPFAFTLDQVALVGALAMEQDARQSIALLEKLRGR